MTGKEWALITFTILAQMSVGAFLVLGIVHLFASRKAGAEQADRLSDMALLAIGPVLVLGLLASLGHLGNPINAPRAITNLGSSWLSREIFSSVTFTVLGAAFALMQWRKISTQALRNALAWLAALVGLFLVFSMSQVYMLETQPAWNTFATPVQFFSTTFLLGMLAIGSAFIANYAYLKGKDPDCAEAQCALVRDSLKWIALASIVILGVELISMPMQLSLLASSPSSEAQSSAAMLISQFGGLFAVRLALVFLGAGLLAVFIYRYATQPGNEAIMGSLAYGAFGLVLISEVVGRFLFYATHLGIGL
jgi:anaerobic dimethyl sulfoxide reductase subunit C (anchor subunit)